MAPKHGRTSDGYRYDWSLFVDWCAAVDIDPLPASPVMLAEFLGEHPASDAVQLRRVSAVNRGHLDAGHPGPGRALSLRLALDSARGARLARRAGRYREIAARLPTSGSTAALFGRRDAVLLLLAATGLPYNAIAALDRTDITTAGDSVLIKGHHRLRVNPEGDSGCSPAEIWERWRTVLLFPDRYPSTTLLAEHLRDNTFPVMTGWPHRPGPIAVPIDRWGHLPFPVAAMTAADIGAVIAAHRTGSAPHHTPRHRHVTSSDDRGGTEQLPAIESSAFSTDELDPEYYTSGVDARRRAHTALAGVTDLVDDVEARIEALLQRTLDLLGDGSL